MVICVEYYQKMPLTITEDILKQIWSVEWNIISKCPQLSGMLAENVLSNYRGHFELKLVIYVEDY